MPSRYEPSYSCPIDELALSLTRICSMDTLLRKIESQLAGLPVPVALRLPAGERVGPPAAAVTLSFKDWSSLATMAAGPDRPAGRGLRRKPGAAGRAHARPDGGGRAPAAGHAGEQRHELVDADAAPGQVAGGPFAAQGRAADPVPLRRVRRFLCAVAGPAPRLFLRLLPRHGHVAGAGAGSQARPYLPQADARARRAVPGHRRGLGRPADVGGGALRRQRHRHHAVARTSTRMCSG